MDVAPAGRPPRLIVGISGASGVVYGIRLLEALRELGIESHLVMTKAAEMTIGLETSLKPKQVAAKADYSYVPGDIAAALALLLFVIALRNFLDRTATRHALLLG